MMRRSPPDGARPDQFRRPTMKRHTPKIVRKNVGSEYHGCLRINVLRSGICTTGSRDGPAP